MEKSLFLHIGMPKCASSTIQAFLAGTAGRLAGQGLRYEHLPGGRFSPAEVGNATPLRDLLAVPGNPAAVTAVERLLDHDDHVILSSETLFDLARHRHPDPLIRMAEARGFTVRLICLLRRQDLWIESDFKQHVKSDSPRTGSVEELIAHRRQQRVLDYDRVLDAWTRYVPPARITLIPLRPGQPATLPLDRFAAALGLAPDALGPLPGQAKNASPPAAVIEAARQIKRIVLARGGSPADAVAEVDRFLARAPRLRPPSARRFLLPFAARQALVRDYAPANARLAATFLDGAPPFSDVVEPEAPDVPPLGDETAELLLAYDGIGPGWRRRANRLYRGLKRRLA